MKKYIAFILLVVIALCLMGCSTTCENCEGIGTIQCNNCNDGMIICTECEGSGFLDCDRCNGLGYSISSNKCTHCSEKFPGYTIDARDALLDLRDGKFHGDDIDKYLEECRYCHGTGYDTITCTECGGSGDGLGSCSSCEGNGKIECPYCIGTNKVACPDCNGKGKVKK